MNNFNFLRLVFALLVVITHCYPLSGATTGDFLSRLTNNQISFSFIGLSGFFTISGYLVFQSLNRSKSLSSYFKKRALRIFPGLFVVLLLTVLLGYFVYEGDLASYIANRSVWTYLPGNLFLIKSQLSIQGIFTHNPFNPAINGSLWSLLYEFTFYIALAALFFFGRTVQIYLVAGGLIVLLTGRLFWYPELSAYHYMLETRLILEFAPFFFAGTLLALLEVENVKSPTWVLVICTLLLIGLTVLGVFDPAKFFLLPIIFILSGLGSMPVINRAIARLGDISYGVYIYAFPIQQTLVYAFNFEALELMGPSLVLSCILGYASWHLVEKRALRLKD